VKHCRSPRNRPITSVPSSISSATIISRGPQRYLCSTTDIRRFYRRVIGRSP
jgi:hypothetical protein